MINKVNLFIIGAPKCGTTALCEYLSTHPDIQFSFPKEAKYFHTDFNKSHRYVLTEKDYHKCFGAWPLNYKIVAEGTVWYLYSRVAVKNIIQYNPNAKFVVMLRNPIDLVYSLHSQLLYGGDESQKSFQKAWQLQSIRANYQQVPKSCRDAKSLQYGDIAKLGGQVKILLDTVERNNVHFVVFDDFIKAPNEEYNKLLNFLGLEHDGRRVFPKINENRKLRSGLLSKLMHHAKYCKDKLRIKKSFEIWKLLSPILSTKSKRSAMTDEMKFELREYFRLDVTLLASLLDRDLKAWLDD
jgi:hypothetical protein